MSVSTNDLKNGMALDLPEGLFTVVEFQHVKPGKGGAFVRTKLKNVRSGAVLERTYRADEKLEQAIIDKREMQYLYREGEHFVFMDNETYDQLHVDNTALGDAVKYLKEGDSAVLQMYRTDIVGVDLPAAVELTITETEPGLQGDRSSAGRKPATVETGVIVQVPLFVNTGDRIKVDTRTGEYLRPRVLTFTPPAGPRRQARERALGLLYEAEAKDMATADLLAELPLAPDPYAATLVDGVGRHLGEIDGWLARLSRDWAVERMPAVDRALLRMAAYELLHEPTVPTGAVIDEAVELAKSYSTEGSGRFVNGVLSKLAAECRDPAP